MDWERALYTCALHLRVIPTSPFPRSRAYIYIYIFFFHSLIGCSSSDIQYKFVIQHKKKEKKRSNNPKGVGAMGLTSHARYRPFSRALRLLVIPTI